MKKTLLSFGFIGLVFFTTGCSGTWEGVKDDSTKAWSSTKKAIHEATADK